MRKVANLKSPKSGIVRLMIYITEEDGTSLFEYTTEEDGPCELDNWYEDAAEAFEYCKQKFGIMPNDWQKINDPLPHSQHDWIKPVRIKGRNKGKPQWGKYEELLNGKWVAMAESESE